MALLQCAFYSHVLEFQTEFTAIVPQPAADQEGRDDNAGAPVLFLLHGLSDNHTIWLRRTSIERYAEELGLAVVMPQVHRSFYTDMAYGGRYWTFLSEELPQVASAMLRIATDPARRYVAGLSMGGYGAMKWALRQPDKFAAAASLSGALNVAGPRLQEVFPADHRLIFGERSVAGSEDDLMALLARRAEEGVQLPRLYQCCGTEDYLYADNQLFRTRASELGIALTYEEGPGAHEWSYWDASIQDVLRWLPLPDREA
ncbi:esterase family protein [Paenibacillus sp. IB182496]|uniref:Esterase family protein n=1 Tax=Paenibacillus sabuli TaxID=2772509 RepID=A0A927BTD1_9BACL|nr:alpha/beta hydrolase family protein [Paenibacillus sabuli]MBD2846433.1 esterase family protein [Paenibacillus sabuli]